MLSVSRHTAPLPGRSAHGGGAATQDRGTRKEGSRRHFRPFVGPETPRSQGIRKPSVRGAGGPGSPGTAGQALQGKRCLRGVERQGSPMRQDCAVRLRSTPAGLAPWAWALCSAPAPAPLLPTRPPRRPASPGMRQLTVMATPQTQSPCCLHRAGLGAPGRPRRPPASASLCSLLVQTSACRPRLLLGDDTHQLGHFLWLLQK